MSNSFIYQKLNAGADCSAYTDFYHCCGGLTCEEKSKTCVYKDEIEEVGESERIKSRYVGKSKKPRTLYFTSFYDDFDEDDCLRDRELCNHHRDCCSTYCRRGYCG